MLTVSSKIKDFDGVLPKTSLCPVVLTKIGCFTKCVFRSWMPKAIEESISEHVLEKDPDADICKVESDNDLKLSFYLQQCFHKLLQNKVQSQRYSD